MVVQVLICSFSGTRSHSIWLGFVPRTSTYMIMPSFIYQFLWFRIWKSILYTPFSESISPDNLIINLKITMHCMRWLQCRIMIHWPLNFVIAFNLDNWFHYPVFLAIPFALGINEPVARIKFFQWNIAPTTTSSDHIKCFSPTNRVARVKVARCFIRN